MTSTEVQIENGKYTAVVDDQFQVSFLRHGKPWVGPGNRVVPMNALGMWVHETAGRDATIRQLQGKLAQIFDLTNFGHWEHEDDCEVSEPDVDFDSTCPACWALTIQEIIGQEKDDAATQIVDQVTEIARLKVELDHAREIIETARQLIDKTKRILDALPPS